MIEGGYILLYRDVKYPRIEVHRDVVKVIVPKDFMLSVDDLIGRRKDWIEERVRRFGELESIARDLVLYDREDLAGVVEGYVREYSEILGVKPREIFFRRMRLRWGSCKFGEGRIIFNKDLRFLPEDLIKYVVLHEMCHLVVPGHRREFWSLVERLDKDYREKEKLLTSYRIKLDRWGAGRWPARK